MCVKYTETVSGSVYPSVLVDDESDEDSLCVDENFV